jgi:hypothetical protein
MKNKFVCLLDDKGGKKLHTVFQKNMSYTFAKHILCAAAKFPSFGGRYVKLSQICEIASGLPAMSTARPSQ